VLTGAAMSVFMLVWQAGTAENPVIMPEWVDI
jgi:hypothetical protein